MCKQCELSYEYNVKQNHDLINQRYIENAGNWFRTGLRVQDGTSISNGEHLIIANDKNIILYDKDYKVLDYCEHNNLIENNLNIFKRRLSMGFYNNISLKEADKKVQVKKWTAIKDNSTCENCLKLNGKVKKDWALFFIDINGTVYSLKSPPLHWVFMKNGQRKITCRCSLEWAIINASDLPREEEKKEIPNATWYMMKPSDTMIKKQVNEK